MAEALKSSWAAAASGPKAEIPLRGVQIDGQAILKIVKHCTECQPSLVTGQLLGLDIGATLEVTNCFPFPVRGLVGRAESCVRVRGLRMR
jgi:translation initiation factor 3 subunit H